MKAMTLRCGLVANIRGVRSFRRSALNRSSPGDASFHAAPGQSSRLANCQTQLGKRSRLAISKHIEVSAVSLEWHRCSLQRRMRACHDGFRAAYDSVAGMVEPNFF